MLYIMLHDVLYIILCIYLAPARDARRAFWPLWRGWRRKTAAAAARAGYATVVGVSAISWAGLGKSFLARLPVARRAHLLQFAAYAIGKWTHDRVRGRAKGCKCADGG